MTCVVVNNGIVSTITTTPHQTLFPVNHFMHPPLANTVHMNPLLHGIIYSTTTYFSYSSRLLLLSADVELNPGPITDKDEILKAISDSNKELRSDIHALRSDISKIKTDINEVKQTCANLNTKMESLDLKHTDLETNMKQVKNEIENIHADRDMVMLDVDVIKELCDTKLKSIDRIDEAVEKLNEIRINVK